jgi:peroxiredoxin
MPTIRFPSCPAKRSLVLAIALVALGAGALCVADSLRAAARSKPEPPPRSVKAARPPALGSWVPDAQSAGSQSSGQHGPRTVHFDLLAKLLADDRRGDQGEWRRQLADPHAACRVETQPHPLLGHAAPDFTLCDHLGQPWRLGEQLAKGPVVVVFYLGYSCNACVHHLCELSADVERFRELGAQVVAISADPPELTQRRFDAYGALGFAVLSDPDHTVARQFGALRPADASQGAEESGPEQPLHGTFIIDRRGNLCWANRGETPLRCNLALLYETARLDGEPPLSEPREGLRP